MRVAQVGLGGFGRGWAEIAGRAPGVELVAVVDPGPPARESVAGSLGIPGRRRFARLEDALAGAEFDAVLLVTPPETHHALGLAALSAGRHLLVEKPLATTLPDAEALVVAADAAGRTLMVSQNYRHRAPARAMRAAIRSGGIGEIVAVSCEHRRDTRALWPPDNFRYAMRHPVILDMAIHHADLLRMLTGREMVSVEAQGRRVPDSPFLHDPAVSASIALTGGVEARYSGDWAASGPETSWNGDWEVRGERGVLRWTGGVDDPLTGTVTLERHGKEPIGVPLPDLPHPDRAGTLEAFRRAVETGEEPETSGRDNLGSLRIVLEMAAEVERSGK